MPTIRPISSLRSYTEVLDDVKPGAPVFLTKNGHGKYAILEMGDYDRLETEHQLLTALDAGRASGEQDGWIATTEVREHFARKATHAG